MQKFCHACGMPLMNKDEFAGGDINSNFCLYCVNEDGSVKSCEEIFEGGVQFFTSQIGLDKKLAEKITRKNMVTLPQWKGKNYKILEGDMATDAEFAQVLKSLS